MYSITITVSFDSVPFYSGIQIAHKSTPHFHTRLACSLYLTLSLFPPFFLFFIAAHLDQIEVNLSRFSHWLGIPFTFDTHYSIFQKVWVFYTVQRMLNDTICIRAQFYDKFHGLFSFFQFNFKRCAKMLTNERGEKKKIRCALYKVQIAFQFWWGFIVFSLLK